MEPTKEELEAFRREVVAKIEELRALAPERDNLKELKVIEDILISLDELLGKTDT